MRLLLLSTFVCVFTGALSQQTPKQPSAKEIIYLKVEEVLQQAGVLVKPEDLPDLKQWKRNANEKMKAKYRSEFDPLGDQYNTTSPLFTLPNWDPTFLGSTLFTSGTFSKPSALEIPKLPIISNNKQLLAAGSGRFNLFYGLNEITNLAVNIEGDADVSHYVHGKLKSGLNFNKDKQISFSVSSSLFQNELARINDDAINNRLKKEEFFTLYLIWQLYSSNALSSSANYYILKSFNGVIWHRDDKSAFNSHVDYSTAVKAELPSLPYIRGKFEASSDWKKENTLRSEFSKYDILIMTAPQMEALVKPEQIGKAWDRLADDYSEQLSIVLDSHGDNIIPLTFGPISDASQYTDISVDKEAFLKQFAGKEPLISDIELVGDPQPDALRNAVVLKVKVKYNPTYFTANATSVFNEEKKLTVRLGSAISKVSLEKDYNVAISAEAKMIPKLRASDPVAKLENQTYTWNFSIDFQSPVNASDILSQEILSKNLTFVHSKSSMLASASYLINGSCIQNVDLKTRFDCNIVMKDPKAVLSPSDDYLQCTMTLSPVVKNGSSNLPYKRNLDVILRGIVPPTEVRDDVVALTTLEEIAKYFDKTIVVGNKSFDDLAKEFMNAERQETDLTKVGDYMVRTLNIVKDPNSGKYLVPTKYINIKKYVDDTKTRVANKS